MDTAAAILLILSYTITDGDTLDADGLGVRLWGIDAPEQREDGGAQARDALVRITAGQDLRCIVTGADRYGRIVARCRLPDGRDPACEMVREGFARDWPRYSGGHYAACD